MNRPSKPPSFTQIQLDEILENLETDAGRKQIGKDA